MADLLKTKTFWAGLAAVIGGIGLGVTTKDWKEAAAAIWAGVTTMFLRDAITKSGPSN